MASESSYLNKGPSTQELEIEQSPEVNEIEVFDPDIEEAKSVTATAKTMRARRIAFITKANTMEAHKVNGIHKYLYVFVIYEGSHKYVNIWCIKCDKTFPQKPNNHLNGDGCPDCGIMARRLEQDEFIANCKQIHGDKYDYSLTVFTTTREKVIIICKTCNKKFEQIASDHSRGYGCRNCSIVDQSHDLEEFIEAAQKVHGDKYGYGLVIYKNNKTPVTIICKTCDNYFKQRPDSHIGKNKNGCPKCKVDKSKLTLNEFIEKSVEEHGNKYDYSDVVYVNSHTKVTIYCKACIKPFNQTPNDHQSGYGCPYCKQSHGERKIGMYLDEHNIKYEIEKTFTDCKYINKLPFDFYIPEFNLLIEFQGKQHYESVSAWGGEERLARQQDRDLIKKNYATEKGFKFLEIIHNEIKVINQILDDYFAELKSTEPNIDNNDDDEPSEDDDPKANDPNIYLTVDRDNF